MNNSGGTGGRGNPRHQQNQDDGPGWAELLGFGVAVAAGAAAIAGGIYLATRESSENSSRESYRPSTAEVIPRVTRRPIHYYYEEQSTPTYYQEEQLFVNCCNDELSIPHSFLFSTMANSLPSVPASPDENYITIAVDATDKKCGGLVRFPKEKIIYYYSQLWSPTFTFPAEPDKFEMVNALVALTEFEDKVQSKLDYFDYDQVVVKVDSNFHRSTYTKHEGDGQMKAFIEEKLLSLKGEWEFVHKNSDDDMDMADRLSRNGPYDQDIEKGYLGYTLTKIPYMEIQKTFDAIKPEVPQKYWTKLNA